MVRHPVRQHAFAALGIAVLLALLAFLLARALSTDFHPDARTLTLLRELADFDARRDAEARRLASDLDAPAQDRPSGRANAASLVRRELERSSPRSSVATRVTALRQALDAKDAAYGALRRAHADTVVALNAAQAPLAALEHAAQATRSRNPDAALALASLIDAVRQDIREPAIERAAEASSRLASRATRLAPVATALDPALSDLARHARASLDAFDAARRAEADAWRAFANASAGEHIALAARTLERRIDAALDARERWRAYLVAYACALALALAFIHFRQARALEEARDARIAMSRELSEQRAEMERERGAAREAQAQLVAMGRYWSIGQLTAGISQEIARPLADARTHLSAVRSALPDLRGAHETAQRLVDLMRSTREDPREVDKAVSALANHLQHLRRHNAIDDLDALAWGGLRDVEHIAELMAQLRGFFRNDAGAPASFNVNDAAHAALLIARPLLQGLHVERLLGDVPAIDCRPGEVIQLALSLIARAAQSVPRPGGRIRVATRGLADGVALDVWSEGAGRGDDGDLAIARQVVARHAGGIAVRASGEGTLVAVELPLVASRFAASA